VSRSIEDKLVLVTGASGGLGYACARAVHEQGAHVLLVGRDSDRLRQACERLGDGNGDRTAFLAGDVSQSDFAERAMTFATQTLGRPVYVLVNNAGTILRSSAVDTPDEAWRELMAVNLDAVFYFSRAAARQMPDGGAIVNISSTCGQVGAAGLAAYCASKGGVDQLTRAMALELAGRKISVNAVAPGAISSPMLYTGHPPGVDEQEVARQNLAQIPLAELADPDAVARSVLFLVRESHITGTILSVDGGYTAG
jgi:NAD(P)-dependent dehydrogenase (short-subunit alcohol dehydrogenase family)